MNTPKITILEEKILSDNHYLLKKYKYEYQTDSVNEQQNREVYDRGNGASVLLYNREFKTVVLIEQFRLPTFLNGNKTGMLIEACAGMMDEDDPAATVIREAEEETGYHIEKVEKAFATYMSPGAVTEILHLFIAEYTRDMKKSAGGGLEEEHEHIETLEIPFDQALEMVADGKIQDAKTIMLLQHLRIKGIL